jgi:hypothetical protein
MSSEIDSIIHSSLSAVIAFFLVIATGNYVTGINFNSSVMGLMVKLALRQIQKKYQS